MGSESCASFKNGCTMPNHGTETVLSVIEHGYPEHVCYITDAYWNYKSAGRNNFHRFLEFKFVCINCGFEKYVRMDKTINKCNHRGKKNICVADELFKQSGLWCWHKKPKNQYNINELIQKFNSATSYYHLLNNNCYHFAMKIWSLIN